MTMEISRFKDGKLKVRFRHEDNSYFWKTDSTECLKFDIEKLRTEVLIMVDWWNRKYHERFEELWQVIRNLYYFRNKTSL